MYARGKMKFSKKVAHQVISGNKRDVKTQRTDQRRSRVARFCATVESGLLEEAKLMARLSGHAFSFSAYISDLIQRDVAQRRQALSNARA